MVREAVILAGGLGTRLRSVVKHVPKPMAQVAGRPFLEHVLDYVREQEINRAVLAIGYKREMITAHFGSAYKGLRLLYSVEETPLGTGGAIKKALSLLEEDRFLIVNGDTYFNVPVLKLWDFHLATGALVSVALSSVEECSRYSTIETDCGGRIVLFKEKACTRYGMVNGGIYLAGREAFTLTGLPQRFSFEKDFLEKYFMTLPFYGLLFPGRVFVDIGIPTDYARAQKILQPVNVAS